MGRATKGHLQEQVQWFETTKRHKRSMQRTVCVPCALPSLPQAHSHAYLRVCVFSVHLVPLRSVGHWLGLTTEDRKELAQTLCQELLFNPQPSKAKGLLVTVEWSATTYWTTYEVDVSCTKTTVEKRKKTGNSGESRIATSVTVYSVHVDDMGRLASFEITVDGEAQGGCSIM